MPLLQTVNVVLERARRRLATYVEALGDERDRRLARHFYGLALEVARSEAIRLLEHELEVPGGTYVDEHEEA